MTSQDVRSVYFKKLSFAESNSSSKVNKSPTLSSHRKTHQARAYIVQNPEKNTLMSQKTLSLALNGNALKLEKSKGPKSFKLTSARPTTKEQSSKPSMTLTEIYAPGSPSSRENPTHRVLKSQSQTAKHSPDVRFLSPSSSYLKQIVMSPSATSPTPTNLVDTLNKKTEEVSSLKRSIQELRDRKDTLMFKERDISSRIQSLTNIEQDLEQKDKIISIYKQLLDLCSKDKYYPSQVMTEDLGSTHRSQPPRVIKKHSIQIDSDINRLFVVDSQFSNPLSTGGTKSTNQASNKVSFYSPSEGKNNSYFYARGVKPDDGANRDNGRKVSPSYRLLSKRVSNSPEKGEISDKKMKTIETIYKSVLKYSKQNSYSPTKNLLSKSFNPSMERALYESTMEKDDSAGINQTTDVCCRENDLIIDSTRQASHRKDILRTDSMNSEPEVLNAFIERFDNILKRYEQDNLALVKKNKMLKEKIDELILAKRHQQDLA